MKKLLAALLALSLVFALAACGSNTTDDTTVAPDTTVEAVEDSSVDATEAPAVDATDATEAASEDASAAEDTTAAENAIPQTKEEIVAYYNAAVIKTNEAGAPAGQSTMKLIGDITGDGALGAILKVAMPIIESTLEKSSSSTDYIPGKGALKPEDVTSATATADGKGNIVIDLKMKDQTDGPRVESTEGPVGRAIGTLGNIDTAIEALGATLYSGADTIKLTYNDCYVKATVNQASGKITKGTWHYKVNIFVGDAEIKLGLKFNAKNLKGLIDYTVAI